MRNVQKTFILLFLLSFPIIVASQPKLLQDIHKFSLYNYEVTKLELTSRGFLFEDLESSISKMIVVDYDSAYTINFVFPFDPKETNIVYIIIKKGIEGSAFRLAYFEFLNRNFERHSSGNAWKLLIDGRVIWTIVDADSYAIIRDKR